MIGVVAVRISAGDGEEALPNEFVHRMIHLPGLPRVADRFRESLRKTHAPIDRVQQHRAAVGGFRGRGELDNDWLVVKIREQDTLL